MSHTNPKHVIGVIGVRDKRRALYRNAEYVEATLNAHLKKNGLTPEDVSVVTGGGRGTEKMIIDWCNKYGIPVDTTPPNIQGLGAQKAFTTRNAQIITRSNELVMFWDGYVDNLGECVVSAMHMEKVATVYPAI